MNPGWKTSEFWLSVVALVVGVLIASGGFAEGGSIAQVLAFVASALTAMGYSVSRGLVKRNATSTAAVLAARREGTVGDPTSQPSDGD